MDLSQYAELFAAEAREHLSACNQLLLQWERAPGAPEPVTGLFRAVHTIKGMAATMGYSVVADLAHRMENLLDALRRGAVPPGDDVLQLLFRSTDALERAVGLAVGGKDREADTRGLVAELDRAAAKAGAPPAGSAARPSGPEELPAAGRPSLPALAIPELVSPAAGRLVQVMLRPDAQLKAGRALLVLKRVEALGRVSGVTPPQAAFESDDFDGRFAFRLDGDAAPDVIEKAARTAGDVERVVVGEREAEAPQLDAIAGPGDGGRARHIRVDLRRLDVLMDLIGELTTARGRLNQLAGDRRDGPLDDVALQISRLSSDLQNEIVQARMTPVWQVFDRFPRLVRDIARQLERHVSFRVEGKEIELDRAILDELGDPLLHLLRNAVDHGIEPSAERRKAGKKEEGEVVLAAVRERASVAITISDDGRGIDRKKILQKAKAEGAVDAHVDALTDDQLLRVIARPGFSTAAAVTNVSGRGVGIDVVMSRIRALGGTVEIHTEIGKGTTFVLRMPVTLAIVRALIAGVGTERYALPLTYVSETVEFGTVPTTMMEGREAMVLRDRVVPLVHLRDLLGVVGDAPPPRRPVIVLEMGERRTGVVVDGMLGQQEIVVKGFEAPRGTLPVFSGATIMGDGVPALILDAGGLL
ncbi:MAG TPA: chemotaxis protein CheA [Gemmatimonadales bacterium]|nr:chemotaxis protein CheA [Gemmatimonadales bacterium]